LLAAEVKGVSGMLRTALKEISVLTIANRTLQTEVGDLRRLHQNERLRPLPDATGCDTTDLPRDSVDAVTRLAIVLGEKSKNEDFL
jgi:hypothetical protein